MNIHPASAAELMIIAEAHQRLNREEGNPIAQYGDTDQGAYNFLSAMTKTRSGAALVATEGTDYLGCVVISFDLIPLPGAALVTNLCVVKGAPAKTALFLWLEGVRLARKTRKRTIWIGVTTSRRKRRLTNDLGFKDSGKSLGNNHFFSAPLSYVEKALKERLKRA